MDPARLAKLVELSSALAELLAEPITCLPGYDPDQIMRRVLPDVLDELSAEGRRAAREWLASPPVQASEVARRYRELARKDTQLLFYQGLASGERLLGPTCRRLRSFYARAGLEVRPEELPDHISVELGFLADLLAAEAEASQPQKAHLYRRLRQSFLQQEALTWMPSIANKLCRSGDSFYNLVGELLATCLQALSPATNSVYRRPKGFPVLDVPEDCYLCGFCVQSCPQGALRIQEDMQETRLVFIAAACTGCGVCLKPCPTGALKLVPPEEASAYHSVVRRSPRAHCAQCGVPIVSQAELTWIARHLEDDFPENYMSWIYLCYDCK